MPLPTAVACSVTGNGARGCDAGEDELEAQAAKDTATAAHVAATAAIQTHFGKCDTRMAMTDSLSDR